MSYGNSNCIVNNRNTIPKKVVSIPVSLAKSIQRKYFVGQTKTLTVGGGTNIWAGLINPHDSDVNLYANVFTISNFSDESLTAEIWLNVDLLEMGTKSHKVSPSNTALKPLPKNKVEIRFAEFTTKSPQHGVNVYKRIVPPKTTLVSEEDGKFIEAPCGNYVIIIRSPNEKPHDVIVALGWWEKSI